MQRSSLRSYEFLFHYAQDEGRCRRKGRDQKHRTIRGDGSMRFFRATNNVLLLLCIMYFITYVDRVNMNTAIVVIREEMNLSQFQVGIIASAFAYPYLVFQIIG